MARAASRASSEHNTSLPRAGAAAPPPFRAVQLAQLVDTVPSGDRWLHEMKYDGYRTLIAVGGGEGRAYTRSGLDWSDRFAGIVTDALKLKVGSALIDGEAVVLDVDGRSSFQALQGALKGAPATIDYFAFDLLELDGEDLTGLPLVERKAKLQKILPKSKSRLRYSDHIVGSGEKLLNQFCAAGLEGVISKLATGKYVDILHAALGDRLVFPQAFVGRGDMSRGGLLLRAVDEGQELEYVPVMSVTRRGTRS